ncbi:MAG: spherulation-specific family 4 protein [Thermoproteota archaeon]
MAEPATVNAATVTGGIPLHMWTTAAESGASGFTPFVATAQDATVTVHDYDQYVFDHWEDGSTDRTRSVAQGASSSTTTAATIMTAYYRVEPPSIRELLPKTGMYVALYSYPGGDSWAQWQRVIDAKNAHPSVPFVVAINPSSGPGSHNPDSNYEAGIKAMRQAGVIVLGYTYDGYGARPAQDIRADAEKYARWYGLDGLFIDEFTNRPGFEGRYRDITAHAKSIGMKMTMGNPGTDVPASYVGTVDVLNITEGRGYMPVSWLNGWHQDYDKRNFSYIRYDVGWLDTSFVSQSSNSVGLMYIHTGNDSNGRWFSLPPYLESAVAALDRQQ